MVGWNSAHSIVVIPETTAVSCQDLLLLLKKGFQVMPQGEQERPPTESRSPPPEPPDPNNDGYGGIPPSKLVTEYLRQRADSLAVTQEEVEALLANDSQLWILTSVSENGRNLLSGIPAWHTTTLGEINNNFLLLLRVRDEGEEYHRRVPHPRSVDAETTTAIVSAGIVRFHRKHIRAMKQWASPLLITRADESRAFAVLHDDRYHEADDTGVSSSIIHDIASVMTVGSWLNEATEQLLVDNTKGEIIDVRIKDEQRLRNAVDAEAKEDTDTGEEIGDPDSTDEVPDTDASGAEEEEVGNVIPGAAGPLRGYGHRIGIGLAMLLLLLVLFVDPAQVPLNTTLVDGVGAAALCLLAGTMLHGDLVDG